MNRRTTLAMILILLTLLFGCETYTARSAKESIQAQPTPVAEGELVTKYSLVKAEEQAKKEAEEAALLTEQQRQAEAEQQQRYEDMQTSIASLQAEKKDTLEEKKLRENQKALSDEQNTTQSLKELLEDRNLLVENKALTYLQDTKELQTTIATLQAKIEENEQAYEMLTYQAGELENLLSEQQIINSELQTIMNENEAEHASEVASLRAAHEQRLRELQNTIESLQTDNTILTSQLEEKTQSLEERLSLEQQRMDEVKRQEEERQALQKKKCRRTEKSGGSRKCTSCCIGS